jgi:hypothetical protein
VYINFKRILSLTAGEAIGGQLVVVCINDKVYKFDPSNEDHYDKVIGITLISVNENEKINVLTAGTMKNSGWTLTKGSLYYAISGGQISVNPPTDGVTCPIGIAVDTNRLEIEIKQSVVKL